MPDPTTASWSDRRRAGRRGAGRRQAGRSWGALLSGVVTLAPLLAGCSSGPPPRVAVVGDSITAIAAPQLSRTLAGTYRVDFVFRVGLRIDQLLAPLQADLDAHGPPAAVVENLGTNDALQGGRTPDPKVGWEELLGLTRHVPCMVLTTVSTAADARGHGRAAARINGWIAHLVATHPRRYKLVDWNRLVGSLPADQASRVLEADGIHETAVGATWLAGSDRAALATCGSNAQPAFRPARA